MQSEKRDYSLADRELRHTSEHFSMYPVDGAALDHTKQEPMRRFSAWHFLSPLPSRALSTGDTSAFWFSLAETEGKYSTISLFVALLSISEDVLRNSTLVYTLFLSAGTSHILDWITVAYLCTVLTVNLDCIYLSVRCQ